MDTNFKNRLRVESKITDEDYARIVAEYDSDRQSLSHALLEWARKLGLDDLVPLSPAILSRLTPVDVVEYHEILLAKMNAKKSYIAKLQKIRLRISETIVTSPEKKEPPALSKTRDETRGTGAPLPGLYATFILHGLVCVLFFGLAQLVSMSVSLSLSALAAYNFITMLLHIFPASRTEQMQLHMTNIRSAGFATSLMLLAYSSHAMFVSADRAAVVTAALALVTAGIALLYTRSRS